MRRPAFLPFSRPAIGEPGIEVVSEVLRSGWITMGPKAAEFEKTFRDYLGCRISSKKPAGACWWGSAKASLARRMKVSEATSALLPLTSHRESVRSVGLPRQVP